MYRNLSFVLALSLTVACAVEETTPEEQSAGSAQAAATVVGRTFVETTVAFNTAADPLGATVATSSGSGDDGGAATTLDDAVGAGSTCPTVSFVGLSATLDYGAGCVTPAGASMSGSMTVGIQLVPFQLFVNAAELTINGTEFAGLIAVTNTGTEQAPGYDLTVDGSAITSSAQLDLDQFNLHVVMGQSITVTGSGQLESATVSASLSSQAVQWSGACLPTSGSLTFNDPSLAGPATATYLATTPIDGEVDLSYQGITTRFALHPPCP